MRNILMLLPAALLWACAEQPTRPDADSGPRSARRSAAVAVDADLDGFTVAAGDCDDTNPDINPRRAEIPGNGIDDDCNASTPDALVPGIPVTADFDAGHNHGDIVADGTPYSGLRFETDNDFGMYYDSNKGRNGSRCLYDNAMYPGDVLWLSITKADFGDFRFDSVWIGATAGNTSVTARGYLDGAEVESEDISVSSDGSHDLNWPRVDEVRFDAETDLFSCFDDFTYASYGSTIPSTAVAPASVEDAAASAPAVVADSGVDAGTASASASGQAITADFDAGHNHGDVIVDGTTYDGLRFETDHDLGMYYDSNKGRNGSRCLYDNAEYPGDVLWLAITKSDFGDFRFDSIWIGATAGNTTITARGYLDGVEVESEDIPVAADGSHALNWPRVDEVRFDAETDLFSCFDDFTYASSP